MIPMKTLLPTTGYIHGGCSPVGMKKVFRTYVHESVREHELMVCSAGKRGFQMEVLVDELIDVVGAVVADVCD